MAPAYYMLVLSLVGLLLGIYLRNDINSEVKVQMPKRVMNGVN